MKTYDGLNDTRGTHSVRVTLQHGEYKGSYIFTIGGNCKGLAVLNPDLDNDEVIEQNCKVCDLGDGWHQVILTHPETGDTLETECDNRDFENMIVALEIIDFKEADKQ